MKKNAIANSARKKESEDIEVAGGHSATEKTTAAGTAGAKRKNPGQWRLVPEMTARNRNNIWTSSQTSIVI